MVDEKCEAIASTLLIEDVQGTVWWADLIDSKKWHVPQMFSYVAEIPAQQAKHLANDGAAGDPFGVRVDIDGYTIIVSADQD